MLIEAASRRWEREHNARVWLAWHVAALHRAKRLPDIKKMFVNNTVKPRQTWREQLQVFSAWATAHNAAVARKEQATKRLREITNGR